MTNVGFNKNSSGGGIGANSIGVGGIGIGVGMGVGDDDDDDDGMMFWMMIRGGGEKALPAVMEGEDALMRVVVVLKRGVRIRGEGIVVVEVEVEE